jgi:hypothetical protein
MTATTDDGPILRVARPESGRVAADAITVRDIGSDFERFPEFVAHVVETLLSEGEYDDRDGAYLVRFSTDRPGAVRRQWEALRAEHPCVWDEGLTRAATTPSPAASRPATGGGAGGAPRRRPGPQCARAGGPFGGRRARAVHPPRVTGWAPRAGVRAKRGTTWGTRRRHHGRGTGHP